MSLKISKIMCQSLMEKCKSTVSSKKTFEKCRYSIRSMTLQRSEIVTKAEEIYNLVEDRKSTNIHLILLR